MQCLPPAPLPHPQFVQELKKKLLEESYELARAKTKDEIASELSDVLEVILAIAGACRITCASLEKNVL